MIHHVEPIPQNLHGNFSKDIEPILTAESGDTIIARTRCCGWDEGVPPGPGKPPRAMARDTRRDPENDMGLCLVGPIAIRGAEPGMTLEVEIQELGTGEYGLTLIGENAAARCQFKRSTQYCLTWTFDAGSGIATASNGCKVRTNPFLGCIGVCPDQPGYQSNTIPRQVGGNLDCKELVVGTKLYLPIEVPGAMLSFGDGHAAQGDGELCGYAIECPMETVKLSVRVRDDMKIRGPVARTSDAWITFGFGTRSREAVRHAVGSMLDLMVEKLGVSRDDAYMLAGTAVDLRITQIANPLMGVHAILRDGAIVRE